MPCLYEMLYVQVQKDKITSARHARRPPVPACKNRRSCRPRSRHHARTALPHFRYKILRRRGRVAAEKDIIDCRKRSMAASTLPYTSLPVRRHHTDPKIRHCHVNNQSVRLALSTTHNNYHTTICKTACGKTAKGRAAGPLHPAG